MPQDRSGTTLGTFRLEKLLGEGGMGEVYVAVDEKLGRTVALKILRPEVMADPEHRARFEREAKALAALNHPGIVTIYALEEIDGVTFFVMDLVEGRTLTRLIEEEGALPIARILDLATPIADAIAAAHKRGIAHRDIKPDNIIVGPRDQITVLDFGLAKKGGVQFSGGEADETAPTMHLTLEGRIFGTVNYMAPEQAEAGETNLATDVFSLGVVIYEMATGDLPFKGDTAMSILSSILKDRPVPMTRHDKPVPAELESLVERCLEKDPDRRWQSALDVRNELEILKRTLAEGNDTSGRRTATAPVDDRPTVGGRMFVITGVMTMIALALGILFGVMVMNAGGGLDSGRRAGTGVAPPQCVSVAGPEGYEIRETQISTDGTLVAMITRADPDDGELSENTDWSDRQYLHLRPIDSFQSRLIENSQRVITGEFSPDGRSYVFLRRPSDANQPAKLMRLDLETDLPPVQIGTIPMSLIGIDFMDGTVPVRGFTWLDDRRLVFVTPIPIEVVSIDSKTGEELARIPMEVDREIQPSGVHDPIDETHFLLGVNYYDDRGFIQEVMWVNADTGTTGVVIESAPMAEVIFGNQLLFTRGETLYLAGFDPGTRAVKGSPAPVFTGLRTSNSWSSGTFDASRNGSVVHLPGGLQGSRRSLHLYDPESSQSVSVDHPPRAFEESIAISGDGNRIMLTHTNENNELWDIWGGTLEPPRIRRIQALPDSDIRTAIISRDGTVAIAQIATTQPKRTSRLVMFDPSSPGRETIEITAIEGSGNLIPYDIHPDNDQVVFGEVDDQGNTETLFIVEMVADSEPRELLGGMASHQSARWSPDGRWLAWTSDESGVTEAFVATLDSGGLGTIRPASDGFAQFIGWSRAGDGSARLHYLVNKVEHVRVVREIDGALELGPEQVTGRRLADETFNQAMDEDGRIVTIRKGLNEAPATRVELIQGFFPRSGPDAGD